jgi:hypothetical protein
VHLDSGTDERVDRPVDESGIIFAVYSGYSVA